MQFTPCGETVAVTPDTGASVTLVDEQFLRKHVPDVAIHNLEYPMDLKGLGDTLHRCYSYARQDLYFKSEDPQGNDVYAILNVELRIVQNLDANLLLGMDVLGPERAIIDIGRRTMTFPFCGNATTPIQTTPKTHTVMRPRKITAKHRVVIPPESAMYVPIHTGPDMPSEYDMEFRPYRRPTFRAAGYTAFMDSKTPAVLFRNDASTPVTIPTHSLLGYAHALDIDGCYRVSDDLAPGAAMAGAEGLEETPLDNGIHLFGHANSDNVRQLSPICNKYPALFTDRGTTIDVPEENHMRIPLIPGWENVKLNIRPYNLTPEERKLVDELFDKLHCEGKMSWATQGTHFGCPVFVAWKTVVDKDGNVVRKGRPVVDLRALNDAVVKDSYPLRRQADILQDLKGASHISVIDGVSFFYQWLIAEQDRHKLAINSHRGQENLHVAIMGYINSIQHVQRQMENIMRDLPFVRVYVDDFIIFSDNLEDHKKHLDAVFDRLDKLRFSLNPKKCYIGYPSVTILGQKVDAFGMATTDERMAAIRNMQFPKNAALLETYIGAVGYMRDKIPYFAQLSAPLQDLKTELLRSAPGGKRQRKVHGERIAIHPCPSLTDSFHAIQEVLFKNMKLHHPDPARPLYIEVDASKEWGIGAFIYHVIDDPEPVMESVAPPPGFEDVENGPTTWLKKVKDFPDGSIEPIMFLSKRLSAAEEHYYPTELEMSAVVWVATKLRHTIAASRKTYVFTDHSAVTAIAQQKLLTSSSADKLNLRLIRCAQYLQQFPHMSVRYRPGRIHFVPDCLSRLQGTVAERDLHTNVLDDLEYQHHCVDAHATKDQRPRAEDTSLYSKNFSGPDGAPPALDNDIHVQTRVLHQYDISGAYWSSEHVSRPTYVFNASLVALNDDFKSSLHQAYLSDPYWKKIWDMLQERPDQAEAGDHHEPQAREQVRGINFVENDGLLYFINGNDGNERLCIPNSLQKEVFQMAHDRQFHAGFHKAYDRINGSMFIRRLAKNLRTYIRFCPPCMQNRTERHLPYGALEPIRAPGFPFHTITIDLVTALPPGTSGFDALMTVTCKQTKKVLLVPGMNDWSAAEWGASLVEALIMHEWGLPKGIISDRDKRFLNELWRAMFQKTGVRFLTSTAWHPQTDGQSERTNQTVEIALRYFVTANPETDWVRALPYIKLSLNTSKSAATGVSPCEQLMGFNPRDPLSALADLPETDYQALRQQYRDMATEALAFAAVNMKYQYDKHHKPLKLRVGDWVMLRLHHGYRVQGHLNRKLDAQRSSPLKVIGKVGNNAYRLDIPDNMKIHPVVSVAQLEPLPRGVDPFGRTFESRQGPVEAADEEYPEYEIESLLDRKIDKRSGSRKYLVRWKGWGSIHNQWYDEEDLSGAKELLKEYNDKHPETLREKQDKDELRKTRRKRPVRGRVDTTLPDVLAVPTVAPTPPPPTTALARAATPVVFGSPQPGIRKLLRVEIPKRSTP
ncbi:hypothetical protein HBH52_015990 [Parastagonospora nodorum]|nr:hypothetical protein HBH52_015990 [Parastagonospora nodorum]